MFENCTADVDETCSNPIEFAECDDDTETCVCSESYVANLATNYSCEARIISDSCTFDDQCLTGKLNTLGS